MGEFRCSGILKTMKRKCRVWWPAHLSPTTQPQSSTFLFGWFVTSSSSSSASVPLEVIVAFLIDEAAFSSIGSDLEGILHKINKRMPTSLQNRCGLSMLGYCSASSSSNGHLGQQFEQIISEDKGGHQICGCHKVVGLLEHYKDFTKSDSIQLVRGSYIRTSRKLGWIPKLHHIHWNEQVVSNLDLHVLIYGTPRFGRHHFSLGTQHSSDHAKKISRKPKWVEDLDQKKLVLDLDTVILATNCAAAATSFFEEQVSPHRPSHFYVLVFKFITLIWQLLAVFVASVSTSVYIVLQLLHFLISYGLESFIYVTLHNLFPHTSRNIRVRCCQILYWPIFLHTNDSRSGSCVEYAEKASQRRHSMWLSVVIDILLGNLFGLTLLTHANCACLTILTFTGDVTNNWWLISCARLMGNPAGFKLNTELAGVLGTLSLNAIQFWSTVLGSMRFLFIFFIKGLATSGVIFGITTPAALTLDMITISTTHISTLHWLISLIYSRQIQATTALWRLFRGQKWNPLRERLDSYDYTVEQHIVGSLLFTPLLLLLPTTSAFYMSFTIMYTTIGFILMIIEVAISVIHATPYTKIFLWLLRPSRFPCGIWFQIFSVDLKESVGSDVLVSSLHSYSYSLGELVKPHFNYLRSAVSRSSISSSVYGVFSGRSLSSALYKLPVAPGAGVDGKMPWTWIPLKEYWMLCYDAFFACNPG
ncbi:N-acetylglucosaminyl-phosphatidylinositol biosynthetic protein gpi1 isoform X1 [Lactuca sativa]|uniref:N-acetylglucosaminyl-phosphatidylinositol biosynthetic protein gpi1 isoform X1 n=1 Tax=Lactuca sativa TaxID=4236 RepID=UPI000CD7FA67|nr:N-acetylglucosaminyl-phosphatidylinositol biosynthetic protein gpi1 isoform X1 [Lactuca sativa]